MIETGLIYRNPKPHLYSRQAAFPSLALLPSGELLASFAIGAGFEAPDQHTELARSSDGGRTWRLEGRLPDSPSPPNPLSHPGRGGVEAPLPSGAGDKRSAGGGLAGGWGISRPTSSNVRISRMPDGELIAFGVRADRSREDEGLTNPETQGFVETELIMLRSSDDGHTWQGPAVVAPPLVGPSFELCSYVVPLSDGRWLWPTSTWKGWEGDCPNGMKAIALVSHDRGQTWPEYIEVMNGIAEDVIFWEQKILDMGDGRLLAVCWTHDLAKGADRPVRYAISADYGRSFEPPRSTGLHGQTSTPIWLGDGRLVCVYRRTDEPGLWAAYARIDGDEWVNDAQLPLWGHDRAGAANMVGGENLSRAFTTLRFGLPAGLLLPDGQVFVAFWSVEDCIYNIRWFRLPIQPPVEDRR